MFLVWSDLKAPYEQNYPCECPEKWVSGSSQRHFGEMGRKNHRGDLCAGYLIPNEKRNKALGALELAESPVLADFFADLLTPDLSIW